MENQDIESGVAKVKGTHFAVEPPTTWLTWL